MEFNWDQPWEESLNRVKAILTNHPVLKSPDFLFPFKFAVDASEFGAGSILLQDDSDGREYPVLYFSKKLMFTNVDTLLLRKRP